MDDGTRYLLMRGMAAAREGDRVEARRYLERLLNLNPDLTTQAEAWYWLSRVSTDVREKRRYLENILAGEPFNPRALREMAILDGQLDPNQVIDPDKLRSKAAPVPQSEPKRFTCAKCGGRLTYSPDGVTLICESCESQERIKTGKTGPLRGAPIPAEQNFIIAMATAKGHLRPEAIRTLTCKGCGAEFLLPPQSLSLACPYCDAIYVIEQAGTRNLVAPAGLIPFRTNESQARLAMKSWLIKQRKNRALPPFTPRGIYFPAWCFTVSGQAPWTCQRYENRKWVPASGDKLVFTRDILIPATQRMADIFAGEVKGYDLSALVDYEPSYLADWTAETYQVPMAEASLQARQSALTLAQSQVEAGLLGQIRDLYLDSASLGIESFKLVLLPAWIAQLKLNERDQPLLVNGQDGEVWEESSGLRKVFKRFGVAG